MEKVEHMTDTTSFKRFNPRKRRSQRILTVTLPNGDQLQCRRIDMALMVMQGLVPMPLLQSVEKLINTGAASNPAAIALDLEDEHKKSLVDMMRRNASTVAVDPKISMTETGDPDVIFVEDLDFDELMAIWMQTSVTPAPEVAAS